MPLNEINFRCAKCKLIKPVSKFGRRPDRSLGHSTICKFCHGTWVAEHVRKLKDNVLEKYGRKCNQCGFSDPRALQLDHVNSDGYAERLVITGLTVFRKALSDTKGRYQLLCANCNWIKRSTHNEMPRRRKSKKWELRIPPTDKTLALFVSGISIEEMCRRLRVGQHALRIGIANSRPLTTVPWSEVCWARRTQLRTRTAYRQAAKHEKVLSIINRVRDELRIPHHDAELRAMEAAANVAAAAQKS